MHGGKPEADEVASVFMLVGLSAVCLCIAELTARVWGWLAAGSFCFLAGLAYFVLDAKKNETKD